MKKIVLVISSLLSVALLIRIVSILITDFDRLTEYGKGYLAGLIILFVFLLIICYIIIKKINKKS